MFDYLAISLFMLICSLYLCGPIALFFVVLKAPYHAIWTGLCAILLGAFWYETIYTGWRYLGLFSAACGLLGIFLAMRHLTNKYAKK